MRSRIFGVDRWNRVAASKASTTHRNEREMRTNLLIEVGRLLRQSNLEFPPLRTCQGWPGAEPIALAEWDPAGQADPEPDRPSHQDVEGIDLRVIPLTVLLAAQTRRFGGTRGDTTQPSPSGNA